MAYAAVTSLMSTLGLILQSNSCLELPQDHEQIKSGKEKVKERVQSLREKLRLLQECLEILEKNIDDRMAVERCEGKIKVAAQNAEYRIESVLEKVYKAENEKVRREEAYEELCKRLQQVSESIDSKSREWKEIMKNGLQATGPLVQSFDLPENSPQFDNSNMVGHVNDLEDMKCKLMDISSDETEVVAIEGMGGIGKTTFARRIYDDAEIKSHFDILAWVTMSKEYCVRRMLLQFFHCIPSTEDVIPEAKDDGELVGKLKKCLWKRRYLIVIDDIWTTKAWDDICQWFPDCRGSHVLLTTRCENVASYAAPGKPPHHMCALSEEESWELLQSKLPDKVQRLPELLEVGRKIAYNCRGVPLTISVVAGLLSKCDNALDRWEQVAENVKSAIFNDPGRQCEKVLALSYCYLPQHLKACFLYFGIFREDYEVNVKRLINLWVAEGFLKENDSKSLEDIAEECLHELIERNLVLVTGRHNFCGRAKACRIHDLLHELCLIQAGIKNLLPVKKKKGKSCTTRDNRASAFFLSAIQASHSTMTVQSSRAVYRLNSSHHYDQKKIRTVVDEGILPVIFDTKSSMLKFKNFRMIRVLALINLSFHDGDPTSLFDLVHLRYLSLTIWSKKFLSLFKFPNLQSLILEIICPKRDTMPIEIWRMPQLRYLCFKSTSLACPANYMPTDEGNHTVLKHLHTIIGVGPSWCRKDIFARLPNMKKLVIVLGNYYELIDIFAGAFCWPSRIEALRISTLQNARYHQNYYREFSHLRGRILPSTLKKLTLCRLRLDWNDMDHIVRLLPNLEALKLIDRACKGYRWKPTNGAFSRLRFMLLDEIDFTEWNATEDNFPVLERLFISHCWRLKKIPIEFANMMTLKVIKLNGCSVQLAISASQIQQEQEAISGGEVTTIRLSNIEIGYGD